MIRANGFSWQGKLLLCGVAAAAIGLVAGLGFYARSEESVLRFEQPEIDLRESPAIEGEPVEVVANLHNSGKVSLHITQMLVSCGCRTVTESEGETTPDEIAPGRSVPIHLRIGTGLCGGEKISHLQVQARTTEGHDVAPAELVVFTYIMVPLAIFPESSSFVLHEEELSAPIKQTVVLADRWPGDGLPIKSITSTLGDKLRYQLIPAHGEIGIGPRMLHKRYILELSLQLDPTKTAFDHTVTITPDHPKAKPVEVHLFGKIIPRCGLDTDSIAFCGTKPGEQISRRIEYHYREASDQEVRMVKSPPWLSVSVSKFRDGLKVLTLTCNLPEGKGAREEEVCFEFGRDKKRSVLPVFVSCQADPRSE